MRTGSKGIIGKNKTKKFRNFNRLKKEIQNISNFGKFQRELNLRRE